MKKLLILFLTVVLVAIYVSHCSAQVWQNVKGIRSVNENDTTAQLAIEGSFYYDDVLNKFYGRNQFGWKEFSLGGGGGGAFWPLSGSASLTNDFNIVSANGDQGFSITSNVIDLFSTGNLGGAAITLEDENIALLTDGNLTANISKEAILLGNFLDGATHSIYLASNTIGPTTAASYVGIQGDGGTTPNSEKAFLSYYSDESSTNGIQFSLGFEGALFEDFRTITRGIEYGTSGYVTQIHSLADKEYVDARTLEGSASLNFPPIATNGIQTLTMTVTGAADGDPVSLGAPTAAVINNLTYFAWVSAANTVSVRAANFGGPSTDPPAATFKVTIHKP